MSLPAGLPASVKARIQMFPIEDIMLRLLRESFPDMADSIVSLLPMELSSDATGLVLVRRVDSLGEWRGDPRFLDRAACQVHVYASGADADEYAAYVSEGIRVAIFEARGRWWPDLGQIVKTWMVQEPTRRSDWVPSTSVVQYADLPSGWTRYQAQYELVVRRPL